MPYLLDPARRLVTFIPHDWPTVEGFRGDLEALVADPLFRADLRVLVDRRRLTVERDAGFVRGAIELMTQPQFRRFRWASLTSHLATYGMGRMA